MKCSHYPGLILDWLSLILQRAIWDLLVVNHNDAGYGTHLWNTVDGRHVVIQRLPTGTERQQIETAST